VLRRELRQPIDLGLRELPVVRHDDEMILDQAEYLHREPQPLARVGVARQPAM
jgi:hypothetical protein